MDEQLILQANLVDTDGFIIEPVIVNDMDVLPVNLIRQPVPDGLYIPRWVNGQWVDDSDEEYKRMVDNPVKEPTETELLKQENTLLKAQIQATTDRSDFHEELIAEMAMMVYP